MPLIASEANTVLNAEAARLPFLSVHTADPGATGANEATAGGRQALTWGSAAAGSVSANAASFTPPAATYGWGGYWTAATGGTFLGSFPFTTAKAIAAGDTLKVTAALTATLS